MKKHRIAALAVSGVVAALLVGSVVIGSNMGFKANIPLTAVNQDQWIAVPYQGPYANAEDLRQMVLNGDGTITRLIPGVTPTFEFWTGSFGVNFAFDTSTGQAAPGDGFQVRPGPTSGASTIIVGSHDPTQTVPFGHSAPDDIIAQQDYWISLPYHTTATNAEDIRLDLPGNGGTITRLIPGVTPAFEFWTGSFGTNFAYSIGDGLQVRFATSGPGYLPAHF